MRLIDADALKEYLKSYTGMFTDELGFVVALEAVLNGIDFQPTIETELKWIPASEPPKESGAYFATIDDSFAKESKLGITVYDGSNWNTWGNIIAWMPLPKAYKGELSCVRFCLEVNESTTVNGCMDIY